MVDLFPFPLKQGASTRKETVFPVFSLVVMGLEDVADGLGYLPGNLQARAKPEYFLAFRVRGRQGQNPSGPLGMYDFHNLKPLPGQVNRVSLVKLGHHSSRDFGKNLLGDHQGVILLGLRKIAPDFVFKQTVSVAPSSLKQGMDRPLFEPAPFLHGDENFIQDQLFSWEQVLHGGKRNPSLFIDARYRLLTQHARHFPR